ncbi:Putative Mn2+ efflux pump MntP [Anaerocolumna jejuensis DSM 15929]|uniref:Putative manganese efflux pump MntP n=1 Tax=Anaerocolumna jejuensis DSM 15929 TaxID=1121322 RepID=A0A1M6PIC0_9FIRM|nr:manganese efflux pump MntP family protein [Anaerocolumna jejuensis]SHK07667.1 Putative Mn2+ efflux pump MntP [Anaerocolumna jejuensis DSM 15929]
MNLAELLILAIGLAMDAFAVAVCKGLSVKKISVKHPVIVGLYFGVFQAVMPMIGYFLGKQFSDKINAIDHWVAFILLGIIGANMIKGAIKEEKEDECVSCKEVDNSLNVKEMLVLSVATSIDALAVGITFAFLKVNILMATSFIGVVTFLISAAGVMIGNIFGGKLKSKAEMAGGIILVCLGTKILLQHLGILS